MPLSRIESITSQNFVNLVNTIDMVIYAEEHLLADLPPENEIDAIKRLMVQAMVPGDQPHHKKKVRTTSILLLCYDIVTKFLLF